MSDRTDANELCRDQGPEGLKQFFNEAMKEPPLSSLSSPPQGWPKPLGNDAYHGTLGMAVRAIEPHSEADPVALLLQIAVAFGNMLGRDVCAQVEGKPHYTNLFCCLIGSSSTGGKGTSWGRAIQLLRPVDEKWSSYRIQEGLSSAEGLISAVRDEDTNLNGETIPGVEDKRLLVVESEFKNVLSQIERMGNTLSPYMRNAWDGNDLCALTKNPQRATEPHISVIGHITPMEFRGDLRTKEICNGFTNRFLLACVRRSKSLPHGGNLHDNDLNPIRDLFRQALAYAREETPVYVRSKAAKELWGAVYDDLSPEGEELVEVSCMRARAQVLRLSMLYAVLDHSEQVEVEHLQAALEVWRYCRESAAYIFGGNTGNPRAETILNALKCQPEGMTREQISKLFSGHVGKEALDLALQELKRESRAVCSTEKTGGRPVERWFAAKQSVAEK